MENPGNCLVLHPYRCLFVDGSSDPTPFDGLGRAARHAMIEAARDEERVSAPRFGIQRFFLGNFGRGSFESFCRQDSPSMSMTWQCWEKRSTRATIQAAPGKM